MPSSILLRTIRMREVILAVSSHVVLYVAQMRLHPQAIKPSASRSVDRNGLTGGVGDHLHLDVGFEG